MKRFSALLAIAFVASMFVFTRTAVATDSTSNVLAAPTATPADWNTAANWNLTSDATQHVVPNGVDDTARFTNIQTGTRVVTLSQDTTIGHLYFDNAQSNRANQIGVLSATSPILTFDAAGSGPATIDVTGNNAGSNTPNNIFGAVVLNDDLIVNVAKGSTTSAAGEFTFRQGSLSGPGGITKIGSGYMTFADAPAKTYTGPTIINQGRFRINGTVTITGTSAITINPGAQFVLDGSADWTFGPSADTLVTLNGLGLGQFDPIGYFPGAIRTGANQTSYIHNKILLASDAAINVDGPTTHLGTLTLLNEISGPGQLIVNKRPGLITREATLILTNKNVYTGGTNIDQGSLKLISNPITSATDTSLGTGNVYVDGVSPAFDANPDGAASGKLLLDSSLAATSDAIANTAYLYLTGGGTAGTADRGYADLGVGVNETVGGLMVGGAQGLGGLILGAGVYGSTASGAANPGLANPDEYFTGTGTITVVPSGVPGDYNNNGVVDAGDYVLWRKGGPLAHDFTPGVQANDYTFWQSRFGATTNPGSGSGLGSSAVPEPSTIALTGCIISLLAYRRRRVVISLREMHSFFAG